MKKFKIDFNNLEISNENVLEKIKTLFKSYFLGLVLIISVFILIITPLDYFITNVLCFQSVERLIHNKQVGFNTQYPFYIIVLLGPLVEEILFRLALVIRRKHISVFLGVLIYVSLGGKISTLVILNSPDLGHALIALIVVFISYKYLPVEIITCLNKKKVYIIKCSIFMFGLMHLSNLPILHWELTLFYPFFVLPQTIMGYLITNLRLKYGFLWGWSLHFLFNAVAFLLALS